MSGMMIVRRGFGQTVKESKPRIRSPFKEQPHGSASLWKKLSLFVALPAVGVLSVHIGQHLKHEFDHPPPRPEFIPYDHLRIRTKRFPWGDGNHSLFHNPHVNALPDGYEDDH